VALEEFVAFVRLDRSMLRERLDITAGGRGVEEQHAGPPTVTSSPDLECELAGEHPRDLIAGSISVGVDNLRAKVKGLLDGLEAEVALADDVMLPTARLVDAMRAFETTFPTVTLRLYV
jgi:hypothetical protein